MVEKKKKELVEHVLMDTHGLDLPKPCKHLHLSCLKVFQMFFNSSNRYDSDTEMLDDINKAIYVPLQLQPPKPNLIDLQPLSVPLDSKSLKLAVPPLEVLQSKKPNPEPLSLPRGSSKSTKATVRKYHFGQRLPSPHFLRQSLTVNNRLSKTSTLRGGNCWKLMTSPAPNLSFFCSSI